MLVKNRMSADPVAVTPDTTLADASGLAREHRVRHLPVVEDGALVGIVSDRDLRTALPSPLEPHDPARADAVRRTPVREAMTRDVVTVGPYDTVEDAARFLCRHRIGALPVVDAHGRLLGMITETDVLSAFAEVLGSGGASSRLEVSLPDRPGELARLLGTLAGLGLNITSLMVLPKGEGGRKTAIVHVATIDPREAIAALEGAGATVGWPSLEADLRREMPA